MRSVIKTTPNRFTRFAYVLGAITAVMMVVNVVLSAELSQDGLRIDALNRRHAELTAQIRDIEQQVLSQTSLNDLSAKAESLDYITPTTIITINSSTPLALK